MEPISGKTIFGTFMDAMNYRDRAIGYVYSGCSLTETTTSNGMRVGLASGVFGVNSLNTYASTASQTASFAAADPTNPRVDSIYIDTSNTLRIGTGTPAASDPVPPAWGTGVVPLGVAVIMPGATDWGGNTYLSEWQVFNRTPMTSRGDLIYGASEGFAQRLGIGSSGQFLSASNGIPTWVNAPTSGMENPMTTSGDMIYASGSGSPVRLPIGASNALLTAATTGLPMWGQGPMRASGDIIIGGGAAASNAPMRLAAGTSGQVLTIEAGLPAWATPTPYTTVVITKMERTAQFNSSSSTFTTITGFSATITVSNTSNLVDYSLTGTMQTDGAETGTYAITNITAASTVIEGQPLRPNGGGIQAAVYAHRITTQASGPQVINAQQRSTAGTGIYLGTASPDYSTFAITEYR